MLKATLTRIGAGGVALLGFCGSAMASTNVTETIDDSIDSTSSLGLWADTG